MTKTGTKENLQKQEKASRQSPRCEKTRKSPKIEENQHSIAARWLPSCHDGSCLRAKCRGDFRTPSYWLALVLKNYDSPPSFNLSKGRGKDRINP
ncbi:hypothetical protein QL285_094628 [Trifolium repens]|nr:hypothetical protein QL285_094628 [Trifolium repens]